MIGSHIPQMNIEFDDLSPRQAVWVGASVLFDQRPPCGDVSVAETAKEMTVAAAYHAGMAGYHGRWSDEIRAKHIDLHVLYAAEAARLRGLQQGLSGCCDHEPTRHRVKGCRDCACEAAFGFAVHQELYFQQDIVRPEIAAARRGPRRRSSRSPSPTRRRASRTRWPSVAAVLG